MTNLQANRLYATLAELSKPITISKEGKPTEVRLSFSGKTCLAIARMKSKIAPHVTACEEAVNAVIAAHGGHVPPDHPAFAKVVKQITEINQSTCDVCDLGTLPLAEFEVQETLPDLEPLLPYLQ